MKAAYPLARKTERRKQVKIHVTTDHVKHDKTTQEVAFERLASQSMEYGDTNFRQNFRLEFLIERDMVILFSYCPSFISHNNAMNTFSFTLVNVSLASDLFWSLRSSLSSVKFEDTEESFFTFSACLEERCLLEALS